MYKKCIIKPLSATVVLIDNKIPIKIMLPSNGEIVCKVVFTQCIILQLSVKAVWQDNNIPTELMLLAN